ncbi:hypothetical protein GCM10022232_89940 [Streptomyces plumbiresistens]|uniref:Uncharacterized protein n=1 Tax=Streptomyces plumbiresistens TaxID=511811 RepID=A0ABP7TRU5_9ACTN
MEGFAPSGSGQDHTMSNGSAIFASISRPPRKRNPLFVYSADLRDLFRDLKRGYLARLPKKWVNAVCKCRSVYCNGTDDTSFRNANSSVCFHAVNIVEVWG